MSYTKTTHTLFLSGLLVICYVVTGISQEFRDIEGYLNNPNVYWGAAFTPVVNYSCPAYADGISSPSGPDRPNPREISNAIFGKMSEKKDVKNLSAYCWAWGQFIDHDITLSPDHPEEQLNIPVPAGDAFFDPQNTGDRIIPMNRSDYDRYTGTSVRNPRVHFNAITAFIDGSSVYGSDGTHAQWLRTFDQGKLKTSEGGLLPFNTVDGEYHSAVDTSAPAMAMPFHNVTKYFVAGDIRANENPFLTSLHTLFVREHNRLCDIFAAENPDWNDEQLYQNARKYVGALIQAIVYEEWLPTMGIDVPRCAGYNQWINPGIRNVFSTAAYRYGHSTITSTLARMNNAGRVIPEGNINLRSAFFNPNAIRDVSGIESYLIGMSTIVQENVDCYVIEDLRNFLFGPPGAGGLDLVSLNINRGRDRGLPDLNVIRKAYGLQPYESFNQISNDTFLIQLIEKTYGDLSLLDPWVGMMAEEHVEGSMFGSTAFRVISEQFTSLRDGDRYYYEFDPFLTPETVSEIKNTRLADIIRRNSGASLIPDEIFIRQEIEFLAYRTIDGLYNNESQPEWGAAESEVTSGNFTIFSDGISVPAGLNRPNPRLISNIIFAQNETHSGEGNLSAYVWGWGQFIDHDITLSPDHKTESMDIRVPRYDVYFDPDGTGNRFLSMKRSDYVSGTGTHAANPRKYYNAITAFIDASNVYGSDTTRANWLRTFQNGQLKMSAGNLLPYNTANGEFDSPVDDTAPEMAMPMPGVQKYFVAGDIRANENPFLVSFHTLFVREHNRICEELSFIHPEWRDEIIYQEARKRVGAIIQAIVFEEWLPVMGIEMDPYIGYDPGTQPSIQNVFSTAAYRYGHSTITGILKRMDNNNDDIPEGHINLRDAFFNPGAIRQVAAIDPYLTGMSTVNQEGLDCYVIDDLRNFLFGPPGAGGLDLVALNINRGRDRGLVDYNSVRNEAGFLKLTSFKDLTSDDLLRQKLATIYQDIDNIDPWVGMLAEDHVEHSMFGKTAKAIIEDQFAALRDGDSFYFENDSTLFEEEKLSIRNTRLSDVIRRNTAITNIQDSIFIVSEPSASAVSTQLRPRLLTIKVHPNPVTERMVLNLELPENSGEPLNIEIYDIEGNRVQSKQTNAYGDRARIDFRLIENLNSGYYLVRVYNRNYSGIESFYKHSR